mmetsp:Transcript_30568/g.27075  ORF Transcript_30568/g.27075 Transcript_30568/m.27075 type:complete len:90 (+) Transcript_30568:118-387(+)
MNKEVSRPKGGFKTGKKLERLTQRLTSLPNTERDSLVKQTKHYFPKITDNIPHILNQENKRIHKLNAFAHPDTRIDYGKFVIKKSQSNK